MGRWTSYNLLFFIKRKKLLKSGKASLFAKITVNKKSAEFVLTCQVTPNIWSKETGTASGTTTEAKLVNEFINAVKFKFQSIINMMITSGIEITAENLKNKYLGFEPKVKTILEIFHDHNLKMKTLIGKEYSYGTHKNYLTSYNHVRDFIIFKYKTNDLEISKIDHGFVSNYIFFLKTEKACNHNTTTKQLGNFKKITRIALNNDWLKKDPFVNHKLSWKKVDRDFLTEDELSKLIKKQFSINRLQIVKDCFLFACYTGLAHSDLKRLTNENLINGVDNKLWISIKRKKTNVQSNIPLLPVAEAIIEKYKNYPTVVEKGILLPVNSNQRMNAYLKEIADLCAITLTISTTYAKRTQTTLFKFIYIISIFPFGEMSAFKLTEGCFSFFYHIETNCNI